MSEWEYKILRLKEEVYGLFLVRLPKQAEWRLLVKMTARSDVFPPTAPFGCVSATEMARALSFDAGPVVTHVIPKAGAEAIAETIAAHRQSPPGLGQIPARSPTTSAVPRSSATPKPAVVVPKRATTRLLKNWPVAMADRLRELREGRGEDYRDVLASLNSEFGTSYSLSAVKAKAARMQLSNYLEMVVESAPKPTKELRKLLSAKAPWEKGEVKASTPEEEGDAASPGLQPGGPPSQEMESHAAEHAVEAADGDEGVIDADILRPVDDAQRGLAARRSADVSDAGSDDSRERPATFYPKVKVPTTIYDIISFWKYQGQAVEERPGGKYMLAGSTEEIDAAELVRRANARRRAGNMEPFVLEAEEVAPLHKEAAE